MHIRDRIRYLSRVPQKLNAMLKQALLAVTKDDERKKTKYIRDRIRYLSPLPQRFNIMLEQALLAVAKDNERRELCELACVVSNAAWRFWLSHRSPADNRQEHEWVVFANIMKIAQDEGLGLSDKRVATAFAFTHDSFFIPRIMEQSVRDASDEEKEQLESEKRKQRIAHMEGGAKNAEFLLPQLRHPDSPNDPILTGDEIKRCVELVKKHDMWKVRPPEPPPTKDTLAVVCLEGDALWPLHPIGVLADLERPDKEGETKDFAEPSAWKVQVVQSNKTLVEFRSEWVKVGVQNGHFKDGESIFRTKEGHRLYWGWRRLWSL